MVAMRGRPARRRARRPPLVVLALARCVLFTSQAAAQRLREYNLWVCPHCERGVTVADVTDLSCEASSTEGQQRDWPWIKQALYRFLESLRPGGEKARNMQEVKTLIDLAGAPLAGECYLGVMALGFFALQFMEPDERLEFMRTSVFGGVTWKRAIPLSYWSVYASGWPIFGILAVAAGRFQQEAQEAQRRGGRSGDVAVGDAASADWVQANLSGITGVDLGPRDCCDFPGGEANQYDRKFLTALSGSLGHSRVESVARGAPLPAALALEYLAHSAYRRCSWGRATAYFALVEGLLVGDSAERAALRSASASSLMLLGEHNLHGCESNMTVYHEMQSVWPFWQVLGRLELRRLRVEVEPMHPAGPGADASPEQQLPVTPDAVRLKWESLLRRRGIDPPWSGPAQDTAANAPAASAAPAAEPGKKCLQHAEGLAHMALSADSAQIDGLLVALQSAVVNAGSNAAQLCFHAFVLPEQRGFVADAVQCAFGDAVEVLAHDAAADCFAAPSAFRLRGASTLLLHCLNATRVWEQVGLPSAASAASSVAARGNGSAVGGDEIDAGALASDTGNLGAVHNFARFVLHELLPGLPRVVYLDVDIVVRGDLTELYNAPLTLPGGDVGTIAAVRRSHQPLRIYVDVLQPAVPSWVPSEAPSFNAGVLVIDLVRWRERNAARLIAEWVALNARRRLWLHGSQPPLLLLFHDEVVPLPRGWNIDGFGHRLNYPKDVLKQAKILHWTGPLKPWRHHGVNRILWEPYALEYCPQFSFREHTTTCRPDSWFC